MEREGSCKVCQLKSGGGCSVIRCQEQEKLTFGLGNASGKCQDNEEVELFALGLVLTNTAPCDIMRNANMMNGS